MFRADVIGGEEAQKRRAVRGGFDGGAAVGLFAFDDADHGGDDHAGFLGGFNGGDGGGAGGANVVDDHHARAFAAKTFDAAAGAMSFFGFAHEEAVEQRRAGIESARQALAVATLETMGSAPMVSPPTASASILLASSSSRMAWPVRRPPSAWSVVVRQSM